MAVLSGVKWYGSQAGNIEFIRPFLSVLAGTSVDVGFGSASLTLNKPQSKMEFMIDIDDRVTILFQQIRDNTQALAEALWLTPWSKTEFTRAIAPLTGQESDLEIARRFAFACTASMRGGSQFKNSDFRIRKLADQSRIPLTAEMDNLINRLYAIADRLRSVQIVNDDAIKFLTKRNNEGIRIIDNPDLLIYADPPFPKETRVQKHGYKHEVEEGFHRDLFDVLDASAGYAFVLSHPSNAYDNMYSSAGWTKFENAYRTNGNTDSVLVLWANRKLAESPRNEQFLLFSDESVAPDTAVERIRAAKLRK